MSGNPYKSDGTLDELATKAKTTTLEEYSYQQGRNYGDKVMQAVDISTAVAALVVSIIFPPMAIVVAAAMAVYHTMRTGISTHDLGMFGQNRDRAEAKQNAMGFYVSVASVATAGLTSGMSGWQAGLVQFGYTDGCCAGGWLTQKRQ